MTDEEAQDSVVQGLAAAIKVFTDAHIAWRNIEWEISSKEGTADVDWYTNSVVDIKATTEAFDSALTAAGLEIVWSAEINGTGGELILTRECKLAVPLLGQG